MMTLGNVARRRGSAVLPTNGLVIEGDSLMAGLNTTNGPISALYASMTGQTGIDRSLSGRRMAVMDSGFATNLAPYYNSATANTLFVEGGTNDIFADGTTLTTMQSLIQSISTKARAVGFKVAVSTITRRTGGIGGAEPVRQAYNAWLLANYATFADLIVDLDGVPQLADPNDTLRFSDGLHLTNASNIVVADKIRQVLGVAATADIMPDSFAFTDVVGATQSTVYTSNTITMAGISAATPISITGGTYSKNGGAYTSTAGTVLNGDTISVRITTPATASTATNAVVTIGGQIDTYSVTTAAATSTPTTLSTTPAIGSPTLSNGNLTAAWSSSAAGVSRSQAVIPTGSYYFEVHGDNVSNYVAAGVCPATLSAEVGFTGTTSLAAYSTGTVYLNSAPATTCAALTTGGTWGVKVTNNGDGTGTLSVTADGTTYSTPWTIAGPLAAGPIYAAIGFSFNGAARQATVNFGATTFLYGLPSGFSIIPGP